MKIFFSYIAVGIILIAASSICASSPYSKDPWTSNETPFFCGRGAIAKRGCITLRRDRSFAEQMKQEHTIYDIRSDYDLSESVSGLLLNSEFVFSDKVFYTHTTAIYLEKNQKVYVPKDCVVLNVNKDTILSAYNEYLPSAATLIYIASRTRQAISYRKNGIVFIPDGCVLRFIGGSLSNGLLVGRKTSIIANNTPIFTNIYISGSWNVPEAHSIWFKDAEKDNNVKNVLRLASGDINNKVIIEEGTYTVSVSQNSEKVLTPPHNTEIILMGTIILLSNPYTRYAIFSLENNNVSLTGNGRLVGDRQTHDYISLYPDATHEFGMGVVCSGKNCRVEGVRCSQMTGDGLYIGKNKGSSAENITVKGIEISNCRRQGISITGVNAVSLEDFYIHDIFMDSDGIVGTNPGAAIDIEPNSLPARDILIRNGRISNTRHGIIAGSKSGCENITISDVTLDSSSSYIHLGNSKNVIVNNVIGRNGRAMASTGLVGIKQGANIEFSDCLFSTYEGTLILGNRIDCPVSFDNCCFETTGNLGYYTGISFDHCCFTVGARYGSYYFSGDRKTHYRYCVFNNGHFVINDDTSFYDCVFNNDGLADHNYFFDVYGHAHYDIDSCVFNLSGTLGQGLFNGRSDGRGISCENTVFNCGDLLVPFLFFLAKEEMCYERNNVFNMRPEVKLANLIHQVTE